MSNIDIDTSKMVFARMRRENKSNVDILDVLAKINPNASPDDLVIFLAECINEGSQKPTKQRARLFPSSNNNSSNGSCSGSSSHSAC